MKNKSSTYIACVYNSPKNSTYTKENECNVLQLIEEQLAKFSKSDQTIIGGDFNTRIGTKADLWTVQRVMNWTLSRHIGTTRMSL